MFSMKRDEEGQEYIDIDSIKEFYNMTMFDNLAATLDGGILSKHRREGYQNIANEGVMARRRDIEVNYVHPLTKKPSRKTLPRFANLYLNPHNAMMSNVYRAYNPNRGKKDLIVFRISRSVLERGDVILTDRNAAVEDASFMKPKDFRLSPESSMFLSRPLSKTQEDYDANKTFEKMEKDITSRNAMHEFYQEPFLSVKDKAKKSQHVRQAEALVRSKIDPHFITGIFVATRDMKERVLQVLEQKKRIDITVNIKPSLFLIPRKDNNPYFVPLREFTVNDEPSEGLRQWLVNNDNGVPGDISDTPDEDPDADMRPASP